MLPKDDTQHQAELRQAFLKHLPRRIELVQKRAQRLASGAWDINLLGVLCQETQVLTGATGRYGLIEASERLYQLELLLTDLLCDSAVPEPATKLRLTDLAAQLITTGEPPKPSLAVATDFILEPAASMLPFPNRLVPPADFWQRFSNREVDLLSSNHPLGAASAPASLQVQAALRETRFDSFDRDGLALDVPVDVSRIAPGYQDPFADATMVEPAPNVDAGAVPATPFHAPSAAVATPIVSYEGFDDASALSTPPLLPVAVAAAAPPTAALSPEPARTRRAYVLAEPGPFAREVTTKLIGLGLTVDRIDNIEELKETLGSLAPDLVVIEELFADQLEHLGEFIRRIRARISSRMQLCAVLPANDLQQRLKAMRAGVDLILPMPVGAAEVAQRAHELVSGEQAVQYRVLIVEDDRSQALFAESVLRKAGMETCAVTDPLATLTALEQFKPDLILMDLYMPGIDGMELTAIIRERDEFISTPIVFLSGEQDSEKHFEALSAGGDDFLAKPIRPKHLISAVTNRARRARALNRRKGGGAGPRDAESGLFDRAYVLDKMGELFGQDNLNASIAFVELDGSGRLREQYGVAGLDALIVQLSSSVVGTLGEAEYASRYGDASLLVLASARTPQALAGLAGQWRDRISAGQYELEGKVVPLQVSIGIAELTPTLADPAALINAAERAMLQARQPSSREKVRVYTPERLRNEEDQLLDSLNRALKLEDFQLLFQPIVALGSTGQEQYEVLLRLRDDDGKLLTAAQFMPVALKHHIAAEIDRFTLSRSLSIIDERRRQGRSLRLFVHQSPASLLDAGRAAWLKQMLDTRKLPPDQLTQLFTFQEVLPQLRAAMPFFQAMRVAGIRLGLDGFESNLTALQLLGYLPVDYLRLAQKYVSAQGVSHGEELRALVSAAHDGGRQVIATRVENAQTAASLWSLGVDLIQGNFVQQPGAELGFDFSTSAL